MDHHGAGGGYAATGLDGVFKIPKVPARNSTDTNPIRHIRNRDNKGASRGRSGRRITRSSAGSNASTSPSVIAITMLTHGICTEVIGNVSPSTIANTTPIATPPFSVSGGMVVCIFSDAMRGDYDKVVDGARRKLASSRDTG